MAERRLAYSTMLSWRNRELVLSISICFRAAWTTSGWQCPTEKKNKCRMKNKGPQNECLLSMPGRPKGGVWSKKRKQSTTTKTHPFSFLPTLFCSFSPAGQPALLDLESCSCQILGQISPSSIEPPPPIKHSGRETGTMGHVIDAIQVLLALLVEHVLPMSTHDFQGVLSEENCAWWPRKKARKREVLSRTFFFAGRRFTVWHEGTST